MTAEHRRAALVAFEAGWDAHAAFAEPEVRAAIEAAYQEGWSDACTDHHRQRQDPMWPIGASRRYDRPTDPSPAQERAYADGLSGARDRVTDFLLSEADRLRAAGDPNPWQVPMLANYLGGIKAARDAIGGEQ
jgi:hypothetical protein